MYSNVTALRGGEDNTPPILPQLSHRGALHYYFTSALGPCARSKPTMFLGSGGGAHL